MRIQKTCIHLLLITLLFCSLRVCGAPTNTVPAGVVAVTVGFDKGKATFSIESKPVRSEDLLDVFGDIIRRRGKETAVVVLIDERNSLAVLSEVRGVIRKAGLSKIKYYCFTRDRERMSEVIIDRPAVRFSLNPKD